MFSKLPYFDYRATLNHLGKSFGKDNIGLYRDDGLAIIKNKSARLADKTRKELHKAFEQFGLKITTESNLHLVNILDVTFDLSTGKYCINPIGSSMTIRYTYKQAFKSSIYTASKNYMQIGFLVILYRFLNQCFGNLVPGIVKFVSAYMQNFMLISATINKR